MRLVHRDADQRRAVVVPPRDEARRLVAAPQSLVGVDELVGDGRDLVRVSKEPGDELTPRLRQLVLRALLVEGVGVSFEERHMRVHSAPGMTAERFRHEGRVDPLLDRDLLDHRAEGHHVVGGRERVRVAQVDLVLARAALVVAELHRDAEVLEHAHRAPPEIVRGAAGDVVEVAGRVHR
ncbi:hypothetical protein ABE10_01060, partial [Bacillus toyonensis]|nr:hypothetical protein [Bacillus toyonensis]